MRNENNKFEERSQSDHSESVRPEELQADPQCDQQEATEAAADAVEDDGAEDKAIALEPVAPDAREPILDLLLIDQLAGASRGTTSDSNLATERAAGAVELYRAFDPADATESVAARLAVSLSNAAMDSMYRGGVLAQTSAARDIELKLGMKLASTTAELLTLIDKHRQSNPRVNVRNVNVAKGGQAIVGNVQSPATREENSAPSPAEDPEEDET